MQVESMISAYEAAEEEADREHNEQQQAYYEQGERIRKACAYHFYTVPAFSVDTSKYDVMVQDAAARFTDRYKLSSLRRYPKVLCNCGNGHRCFPQFTFAEARFFARASYVVWTLDVPLCGRLS